MKITPKQREETEGTGRDTDMSNMLFTLKKAFKKMKISLINEVFQAIGKY